MSDKTLVERLRELDPRKRSFCLGITSTVGIECSGSQDCLECKEKTFNALADTIEREYLPRPILEGEPLKIGDKVDGYSQNGAEVVAVMNSKMVVVRSTVKGGNGYHDEAYSLLLWSVDGLKRPEPEVLDADGVPIKVGDVVWFVNGVERFDVLGIESCVYVHIGRKDNTSTDAFVYPFELTHKQPDSLECIEEDALMASIDYCDKYGLLDSECNAEEGDEAIRHCTDCELACETRMVKHILRRQREVLERDHER